MDLEQSPDEHLALYLLVSSADEHRKKFRQRSGQTKLDTCLA